MIELPWLNEDDQACEFPPVTQALSEPNGLLAAGGRLSPQRLEAAYARGIFPWFSEGQPVLWWSPDPRALLYPQELRVSRSLRKRLRNGGFRVSLDENFPAVLRACAAPREDGAGTWITEDMQAAYRALAERGVAHSVEVRRGDALVGGLYGVALGGAFFGESMFSRERDGSKIALCWLAGQLRRWGYAFIDCQLPSAHLMSMGARSVARADFIRQLQHALMRPGAPRAPWCFDLDYHPLTEAQPGVHAEH
ncbi:leucyl/phenylalanyl-tRNA--protein transferase [Alkalilimnicola sp. S0819]|uniref:leucyl/phenylalanyl-tRNA--protein transferase n=1 Tax=Alkalilimnicola sp. S0819 TaxID=2613922 RepID=UPI0012619275|nr:leucyl/phenylalanyl-tRNA--protein transferase [Alkalilimnicola sp. S0819]KAB7627516.1 leucyl/phenylalanyl-tRNA--protein transferase [Alkalilimnicola sp. S0819]MPQ15670.1 leucyl/phenylalanyl-tRNA--protein transferase [Alkalilimnicola sp. S0819]